MKKLGTEPDFPYSKKPLEPVETVTAPPMPPPEPPTSPSPPPFGTTVLKSKCQICGKEFNTKQEFTLHMETVHAATKKET